MVSIVTIFNCSFSNITISTSTNEQAALIEMYFTSCNAVEFSNKQINQINVLKCNFYHNINYNDGSYFIRYMMLIKKNHYSYNGVTVYISDSEIFENNNIGFLMAEATNTDFSLQPINIIINNTRFAHIEFFASDIPFLYLDGVFFQLEGPIIFTEIETNNKVIIGEKTHMHVNGYIEFSCVKAFIIVQTTMFYLHKNTVLNFTSNRALDSIFKRNHISKLLYPPCLLQYVNTHTEADFEVLLNYSTSIIIDDNEFSDFCEDTYCTSHCSWVNNTIFNDISPLVVNRKVIENLQDNSTLITDRKDICYCSKNDQYDCYVDEINSVYPGQTIHLTLINTLEFNGPITVHTGLPTSCRIGKNSELVQLIHNNCTKLQFTIDYSTKWCELFLSYSQTDAAVFYVNLLSCPPGFSLNRLEGYCHCDPILTSARIITITGCNINDQTILHPGNSWIHITSSHTYQVSLHCPFHYC